MFSRKRVGIFSVVAAAAFCVPAAIAYGLPSGDSDPVEPPGYNPEPPGWDPPVRSEAESYERDGRWYAEAFGVTPEEGAAIMRAQGETGPFLEQVQDALPHRIAGIWREHKPENKYIVWVVGAYDSEIEAVAARITAAPIRLEFRVGAPRTLDQILTAQRLARPSVPDLGGIGIDQESGSVTVFLRAESSLDPEVLARELTSTYGVPFTVTIPTSNEVLQETYGGTNWDNLCTTGFTVSNTAGATGVTTAGHCPNSSGYVYWNRSYGPYSAQVAGEWYALGYAQHDLQWMSVIGDEIAAFWDGSQYAAVTGTRSRAVLQVNDIVCHFGNTSQATCGKVADKAWSPGTLCPAPSGGQPGGACDYTFIKAVSAVPFTTLRCQGGDSGGPWFYGGTAIGSHMSAPDNEAWCTFMSVDYIASANLTILTQ